MMPEVPAEFTQLLPKRSFIDRDDRPFFWHWVYDPQTDKAEVDHSEDKKPNAFLTHKTFAKHVVHPDQVRGFVEAIKDGWRIMDTEGKKIEDPYIIDKVQVALRKEHPKPPLPNILPHGDPLNVHANHPLV